MASYVRRRGLYVTLTADFLDALLPHANHLVLDAHAAAVKLAIHIAHKRLAHRLVLAELVPRHASLALILHRVPLGAEAEEQVKPVRVDCGVYGRKAVWDEDHFLRGRLGRVC